MILTATDLVTGNQSGRIFLTTTGIKTCRANKSFSVTITVTLAKKQLKKETESLTYKLFKTKDLGFFL